MRKSNYNLLDRRGYLASGAEIIKAFQALLCSVALPNATEKDILKHVNEASKGPLPHVVVTIVRYVRQCI